MLPVSFYKKKINFGPYSGKTLSELSKEELAVVAFSNYYGEEGLVAKKRLAMLEEMEEEDEFKK